MNKALMKLALDRGKLAQSQNLPHQNVGVFCVNNFCRVFITPTVPIPLKGIRLLRVTKNERITDLCNDEVDVSNRAFNHYQHTCAKLKDAATRVRQLAMQNGNSKWSLSDNLRLNLLPLRTTHDASPVGINNILQNNPFLTTRLPHGGKNPIQIAVKSHLRMQPALETSYLIFELRTIPEMIGGVC